MTKRLVQLQLMTLITKRDGWVGLSPTLSFGILLAVNFAFCECVNLEFCWFGLILSLFFSNLALLVLVFGKFRYRFIGLFYCLALSFTHL